MNTDLQVFLGGYAISLLLVIWVTGQYKRYYLHWLILAFFVINNLLKYYNPHDHKLFFTVHTITFLALLVFSEVRYRMRKQIDGLKANLFPMFIGVSFIIFSLLKAYLPYYLFIEIHAGFIFFVMTALVAIPVLSEYKKFKWMRQFLF